MIVNYIFQEEEAGKDTTTGRRDASKIDEKYHTFTEVRKV